MANEMAMAEALRGAGAPQVPFSEYTPPFGQQGGYFPDMPQYSKGAYGSPQEAGEGIVDPELLRSALTPEPEPVAEESAPLGVEGITDAIQNSPRQGGYVDPRTGEWVDFGLGNIGNIGNFNPNIRMM